MYKLPRQTHTSLLAAAQAALAWVLRLAACYLIPLGIGLVSLLALVYWHDQYSFTDNLPLDVRVLAQDGSATTPFAALDRLKNQGQVRGFDTDRAETPFWFSFDTVHRVSGPEVIEFPDRHAVDLACWDTAGMTLLGAANRNGAAPSASSALAQAKAGFALRLSFMPAQVLCRATSAGPGHVSVAQWPADQFARSIDQYHRKSGLLDGGMIVLALFVLMIAAIHGEALYAVFAGWLILNLRIGAMTAGWDIQWLGQTVPAPWLMAGRSITVVLFGISTLMLYQMLLGEHLVRRRERLPLRIVQWLCLPMLAAALVLPFRLFVPVLWGVVLVCMALLTADLARILLVARSRVALYFSAALAVAFAAGIAKIMVGALDLHAVDDLIDSVTAALASSLLAALAVAERVRVDLAQRITAQAELGHTWDAMPAGLFTLDTDGRFLTHTPALCTMLGNAVIVPGLTPWQQFFSEAAWKRLDELLQAQQHAELDMNQNAGGRRFLVRATLVRGRIAGMLENITEQARETGQLRFLSRHDPVTRVLNRRGIDAAFDAAGSALAAGSPLALAYFDLDRFRLITALYGHAAGDEVLKQVCERIAAMLAGGQQLGRIGGDAFVLLLPDTSLAAASLACRTMVERIGSSPYVVGDKAVTVHAALGLIQVAQGMHLADAIASAERACREAAADRGAGTVNHADPAEAKLVARLSSPNATEGLFLDMQPVVSLAAPHASLNADVLLRMRTPDGCVVGAAHITAAAGKSGRAGVIDRWVLSTTLEWIERHAALLPAMHFVCVKVSGAALNDEHFVQDLLDLLYRHAGSASRLCLEVSESVALQDIAHTLRIFEQVRAVGVKLALDEFGTSHAAFSCLKALQLDLLKIDASLSANIDSDPDKAAIVEAIVYLARKLGVKTVAPGAHDSTCVRVLAAIGVDYVQGDAVARAQPMDAMVAAHSSANVMVCARLAQLLAVDAGAPAPQD
ncbi:MAG TPA: EAL domain-containing protein [Telluria sp.]|jgi:diguanylate cyclase (GGDEF)-like protein